LGADKVEALAGANHTPARKRSGWLAFDLRLSSFEDLNNILDLLRKQEDGIGQQKGTAADLAALVSRLKIEAPGVRLAEQAERAYAKLNRLQPQS
jgi:hypothetical protein